MYAACQLGTMSPLPPQSCAETILIHIHISNSTVQKPCRPLFLFLSQGLCQVMQPAAAVPSHPHIKADSVGCSTSLLS
jgi:hypothetical protein